MLEDVKIFTCTDHRKIEEVILKWSDYGYSLSGSVVIGQNNNGNMVYVATLTKLSKGTTQ